MHYNVDKHTYWIYDKLYKGFISKANTKEQLYSDIRKYVNIDSIDYSGGDTKTVYDMYNDKTIYTKRYLIYDNNSIMNFRNELDAYHKYIYRNINRYKPKHNRLYNAVYGDKCKPLYLRNGNQYKFRCGTVPGIGRKHRYRKYFSIPNIKRHLKVWSDIEYRQYMRKPNLIKEHSSFWFDDFKYRGHSKTWKNNKKIRHQWEKNLRL